MSGLPLRFLWATSERVPSEGDTPDAGAVWKTTWSLPDGTVATEMRPGDVCFMAYVHKPGECWARWSNCDGRHLHVMLPNEHTWDIDSRASNCGSPDDTTHRCWVRHGDPEHPETLHVDKSGTTCSAGAGSIVSGDYHGFLHHGRLVPT